MASFYGNIKNNSRASFIFDRFYPSRTDMETALREHTDQNGTIQGDGVFVNRYVLVNYGYTQAGLYARIDPAYCQPAGEQANANYIVNSNNFTNYYIYNSSDRVYEKATTQLTTAQLNNAYYYYQKTNFVDRFDGNVDSDGDGTPNTTLVDGRVENTYFADNKDKDRRNYHADYHLTVWMKIYSDNEERYIQVGRLRAEAPAFQAITDAPGELAPHFDLVQSSDINYMYHLPAMWDILLNTATESGITYPYFNVNGFNETTNKKDTTNTNAITMPEYQSNKTYPTHIYQKIDITPDTYIRNWYYTKSGNNYNLATGDYNANTQYYLKTQKTNSNGSLNYTAQNDQRRLTLKIPAIGNAVSDMYDALYGFQGYGEDRKYTRTDLFNTANIEPYNNLSDEDKVSMAWGVVELKKYISELRFLSNGQIDGEPDFQHHGGLQSDWTLDDTSAFGYIYHKPRILWSNSSNEAATSSDTNYLAAHTIEYIYDNYTVANTTLFGPARNNAPWLNAHY